MFRNELTYCQEGSHLDFVPYLVCMYLCDPLRSMDRLSLYKQCESGSA